MNFVEYIFLAVLSVLALNVAYLLFFGIAGLFNSKLKSRPILKRESSFLIMVPGYKEDGVIVNVARNLSEIDYPKDKYDVLIIADSFHRDTLNHLNKIDVNVLEVCFEKSTKAKALNKAVASVKKQYDYSIIMDADNIVDKDFLNQIESVCKQEEIKVLQCHRVAKNINTNVAVLDTVSEEINNHIFRKGHVNLGLSSSLIGSGMVFDHRLISSFLKKSQAVGGFDKELEIMMLKEGIQIKYLNDCFVYDEKVQKMDDLNNQRRRWMSAHIYYLRESFFDALKEFFIRGNIDYLDKSLQMALIPRVLLLGLIPLMFGLSFFLSSSIQISCLVLLQFLVFTILISIPGRLYNVKLLKALAALPNGIIGMFLIMFKLKGANKTFIHTPHSTNSES